MGAPRCQRAPTRQTPRGSVKWGSFGPRRRFPPGGALMCVVHPRSRNWRTPHQNSALHTFPAMSRSQRGRTSVHPLLCMGPICHFVQRAKHLWSPPPSPSPPCGRTPTPSIHPSTPVNVTLGGVWLLVYIYSIQCHLLHTARRSQGSCMASLASGLHAQSGSFSFVCLTTAWQTGV